MKIVFMGSSGFSIPSFEILFKEGYKIETLVTQPDKPRGRGEKVTNAQIKELALSKGIKVFQPEKLKGNDIFFEKLKNIDADFFVVVSYGQILTPRFLKLPKYGCVNIHGSLLPLYRGAAPIQRAIINGEKITGVTSMFMDKGIDTGDILLQEQTEIGIDETYGFLYDRLAVIGAKLLLKTLEGLKSQNINPLKQDGSIATYSPILVKEDGFVDFSKTSVETHNIIRGVNPWPGAYTFFKGKRLKIIKSSLTDKTEKENADFGIVQRINGENMEISCKCGNIIIETVQPESGKQMTAAQFSRGYGLKAGIKII